MGHLLPVLLASSLFLSYAGTQASHLPVIYSRDINATAQLNATATARHGTNGNSACELYAVASGDTCYSVSLATNISYAQVLAWNPGIDSSCSNLAALRNSSSICISNPAGNYSLPSSPGALTGVTTPAPIPSPTVSGTTSYCGQYYLVGSGDDCSSVALGFGITEEDFVFLNPELDANCSNLELGYYYCVEAVGSISTYSGYITTTATSTAPFNQTSATPLSDTGDIWANYTSTGQAIPIASDTRVDCYEYVVVTNLTNNTAADCWALASIYQLSPEDFILWNPSLAQGEAADGSLPSSSTAEISSLASSIASAIVYGNATATATATAVISGNATSYVLTTSTNYCAYPCTLSANTSYCVALASPTSSNVTTSTVSTPSPVATGEASNCTQFYQVQSYDTCANILALFDLTIAQFYFMNPSVGSDCTGMDLNYYYCVSIWPNGAPPWTVDDTNVTSTVTGTGNISTSSATTSTTSTGTGVVTPIPIQTGMVFDCDKFYLVKPDDGCEAIATEYNVSLSDFYAWNPAVGDECYYLDVGDYVCVGVSGATLTTATPTTTTTTGTGVTTPTPTQSGMVDDCDKFYLVQSDDGCDSIASSEGISVSDFYAWNPEVGDDCTNLWLNYYVCVGVED